MSKKERRPQATLSYGDIVRVNKTKEIGVVREEFIGAHGQTRIAIDVDRYSVIVVGRDEVELLNKRTQKDIWNSENKSQLFQAKQK